MVELLRKSSKTKIAVGVFATICLLTFALSCTLPIYVDETNWQLIKGRLFVDDYQTTRISPALCVEGAMAAWPWFMVPFRAVDSIPYIAMNSPLYLRTVGAVYLIFLVIVLMSFCVRYLSSTIRPLVIVLLISSFLSLGTLPFLLMMNRPEQGLLLLVGTLFFLPLITSEERDLKSSVFASGLIAFLSLCLFTTHPKGVFFMPIALASAWYLVKPWPIRAVVLATILVFGALSAFHWQARLACPNLPAIQAILDQHSLSIAILSDPRKAARIFYMSALKGFGVFAYVKSILFQHNYMSDWLPSSDSIGAIGWLVDCGIFVVFGALGATFLLLFAKLLRNAWSSRSVGRQLAMICMLLISLSALAVIQVVKNAYEATLVVPLWGLLLLIASRGQQGIWFERQLKFTVITLVSLSTVSQLNLWRVFGPNASWRAGGYIPGQVESVSTFNYSHLRQKINSTAMLCGIGREHALRRLVLDELTYFSFSDSYQPVVGSNLTGTWGGSFDLPNYLKKVQSSGAVAACKWFPSGIEDLLRKNDEFCCLPSNGPR
jgi:hypothetical protein